MEFLVTVLLHLLLVFQGLIQGSQGIHYTGALHKGEVITLCGSTHVTMPWTYALDMSDGRIDILNVKWYFDGKSPEQLIGVSAHGRFTASPSYRGRVSRIYNAGLTLKDVVPADAGEYTVVVTGYDGFGRPFQMNQTNYLQISDSNVRVRLMGGSNEREGRVEVWTGSTWGTVCSNGWDDKDAQVVCRMLGFVQTGSVARAQTNALPGTGPIVLDTVACNGNEPNILLCGSKGFGSHSKYCTHSKDAGVVC